jgi:ADP-heptose:LPS heptosyltransferase
VPRDQVLSRILAIRLDNVGAVLMLGPALMAIRRSHPAARLTLMTSPAGCQAVPLLPWVDDVLPWRAAWQDASSGLPLDPAREWAMVEDLRRREFDAAFIFTSFSQSPWPAAYACCLASVPVRVGQARDLGGSLLTERVVPAPDCVHQAERNLHLVESVGIEAAGRDLAVRIPDEARSSADALLRSVGVAPASPFVVVAPSASRPARRYAPGRFAEAMNALAHSLRVPQVVVGSSRDAEVAAEVVSAAGLARTRLLVGRTSVPELAAILERARLLLANNSAPIHLADAVHCPMVVLYSGTDLEEQWRPRAAPAFLLRRPTQCEPCYRFECPYQMECLDIPASEVLAACEEMWERTAHRARPRLDDEDRGTAERGAA